LTGILKQEIGTIECVNGLIFQVGPRPSYPTKRPVLPFLQGFGAIKGPRSVRRVIYTRIDPPARIVGYQGVVWVLHPRVITPALDGQTSALQRLPENLIPNPVLYIEPPRRIPLPLRFWQLVFYVRRGLPEWLNAYLL